MDRVWAGEGGANGESIAEVQMLPYVKWISGTCYVFRSSTQRSGQPRGWDGVGHGKEVQEGGDIYVYLWLIHVDVWQKTITIL